MALHHTAFPGTISLQPSTLIQLIKDYVTSLARVGFQRFFFINGHGGNIATLKAAFAETYYHLDSIGLESGDRVQCKIGNWFMCAPVYKRAKELYGNQEGSHATPSEVAVTQYLYPDAVKHAPLADNPPTGHPIYSASDFRRHYPDGRMGSNPALATPEHGQQLLELAVKDLSNSYLEFAQSD